ncbi:MAG: hypothetical protein U0491_02220 [Candidatus Saccharimonadales bacterium]
MFKRLNAKGFSHHLLLFIIPIIAVAAIGAYVISSSRASGGFVCTIGPEFKDVAGTTDGGVMNDNLQWYSVVLQNRTGTATSTLNDIAFVGKSSSGSTFTWNAQTYDGKYIDWLKGFSGVKILNNGTVQGQVRKPTTPAGVGQANWSVIVKGVTYSCNTTTNINTTYTSLVNSVNSSTPTPTTPAPAPTTPPPTTTTPAPATPVAAVYNGTFACTIGNLSSTTGTWYSVKITNNTDNSTATLDELNMVGTKADNSTVVLNGKTNASSFSWVKGFSGTKIIVRTTAEFNVSGSGVAQDKWKFRISGKDYPCVKEAAAVDTKPYTTLPGAPSAESMTYASWKAWSDGVTANKALTGQALVDKLKPLKEAYDAKVSFAATITCKAVFPAKLTLGTLAVPKQNPVSLTVTNKGQYATPANTFTSNLAAKMSDESASKMAGTVNVPTIGVNATVTNTSSVTYVQANGKKVTLSFKLLNADKKVVANCENSYKTYDLSTGSETATPNSDKPVAVVVANKPPVISGNTPPANSSTPAVKKIADLGYGDNLNLQCISRKGTGKAAVFTAVPCAQANTLILTVSGKDNSTVPRNKLSYGVDVSRDTTDHFGTVRGCAPRTVIVGTKKVTYDCTIVYYNQSFFESTSKTIGNFFKSIVAKAKADTYLSKSEAKADIAKLRAGDLRTAKTKIVLSHPGYVSQIVNGENLVLDYNEASSVNQIVNIAKSDCENKGGTFNTSTYGCTISQSGGSSAGSGSGTSNGSGGSSTSRPASPPTRLPNAAARRACIADGGRYSGNVISGWKCVYPAGSTAPVLSGAALCAQMGGTMKGSTCLRCSQGSLKNVPDARNNIDGWVCAWSSYDSSYGRNVEHSSVPTRLNV